MRCNVWVDRDMIAATDDEPSALAFIREHFDDDLVLGDVWLELRPEAETSEVVQGDQLLERVRRSHPVDRLSV